MKVDWQDPIAADLAEVLGEVMKQPLTHVQAPSLVRTLRSLPPDLAGRLSEPEREDLVALVEDATDVLRDAPGVHQTHLGSLIDDACRLLGVLEHRLDEAQDGR